MSKKSFILSSAGLKNLVNNQNFCDDFKFIFGHHEIKMKNVYAEFISPYVSQIHHSDPTIDTVCFPAKNSTMTQAKNGYFDCITDKTFSYFESISKGEMIYVDDKEINELQIISIFIKNDELFNLLEEVFEDDDKKEYDENRMKAEIAKISFFKMNYEMNENKKMRKSIEYIARNFYLIDISQIKNLPITVFIQSFKVKN